MTDHADPARGSPDRFGFAWAVFSDVLPIHELQFKRWTAALGANPWPGSTFLDVGCGMGRNSFWAIRNGAASGRAIDIDERSLAAARRNLAGLPVAVENRSAFQIDEQNAYDIVFSVGVVHHLDNPELAVAQMTRAAKPGGRVMIWVYGLENNEWIVRWFSPLRRALFSRWPLRLVYRLSWLPTLLVWGLLRIGWGRLEYHRLLRQLSFRHLRAIVFDQMIPQIARHYRRDDVETLMHAAGLRGIRIEWVNEMSWSAAGTKPPGEATL